MKWEYMMVSVAAGGFCGGKIDGQELTERLNELGRQCWELVSIFDTNFGQGGTRDVIAVLKRPLE